MSSFTGREGQHRRARQQVRLAPVHPGPTQRLAPPRVQRLSLRQGQQTSPATARGEQDHLPVALDQHVLLAPAVRVRTHGGGHPRGHRGRQRPRRQARGGAQAQARARHRTSRCANPKVPVPHQAALLRVRYVRREPDHRRRAVGGTRDGLHPVHQTRRTGGHRTQPRGDRRYQVGDAGRAAIHDGGPEPEVVAVVPDNLRTISRYVVGRPGRDDRERCARGFGDDPRGDVIGAQRVTRRR